MRRIKDKRKRLKVGGVVKASGVASFFWMQDAGCRMQEETFVGRISAAHPTFCSSYKLQVTGFVGRISAAHLTFCNETDKG